MNIVLINTSDYNINVSDLGIEIHPTEVIDLYQSFSIQELLVSSGIQSLFVSEQSFRILIDGSVVLAYSDFVKKLTFLTSNEHETIPSLKHMEFEPYYFEVTKVDSKSKFITYYKDNTKAVKIREEIIMRDTSGRVNSIQTIQYNENGLPIYNRTETLNRDCSGKILSTQME